MSLVMSTPHESVGWLGSYGTQVVIYECDASNHTCHRQISEFLKCEFKEGQSDEKSSIIKYKRPVRGYPERLADKT